MTGHVAGPLGNSEFCFPRETKFFFFPQDQSLSVQYNNLEINKDSVLMHLSVVYTR